MQRICDRRRVCRRRILPSKPMDATMTSSPTSERKLPMLDAIPRHEPVRGRFRKFLAETYVSNPRLLPGLAGFGLAAALAATVAVSVLNVERQMPRADVKTVASAVPEPLGLPEIPETQEPKDPAPKADAAKVEPAAPPAAVPVGILTKIPPVDLSALGLKETPGNDATVTVKAQEPTFQLPVEGVPDENQVAEFFKAGPSDVAAEVPAGPAPAPAPSQPPVAVQVPADRPKQTAEPKTKVFRLVQGKGKKSGFWMGNRKDTNARRYFLVAAVESGDGTASTWKFKNVADGNSAESGEVAVEVPEAVFRAMSEEYAKSGKVANDTLGTASGSKVAWNIRTVEGNMMAGWNKEKEKAK